jgi:hypothetical protein
MAEGGTVGAVLLPRGIVGPDVGVADDDLEGGDEVVRTAQMLIPFDARLATLVAFP